MITPHVGGFAPNPRATKRSGVVRMNVGGQTLDVRADDFCREWQAGRAEQATGMTRATVVEIAHKLGCQGVQVPVTVVQPRHAAAAVQPRHAAVAPATSGPPFQVTVRKTFGGPWTSTKGFATKEAANAYFADRAVEVAYGELSEAVLIDRKRNLILGRFV